MQTIDPIKPVKPPPPPRPRETSSPRTLDGVSRTVPQPRSTKPPPLPMTGARFTKLKGTTKKRRMREALIVVCVSPVLLALSAASFVGMVVVGVYGIVAIVLKLSSRVTFMLALAAFIYMFSLRIAGMTAWVQTEAVMAYTLLAVGVLSLAFETRRPQITWSKKQ